MHSMVRRFRARRARYTNTSFLLPTEGTAAATDNAGENAGNQAPGLRSMSMNTYASQQASRQTPRLQNTQKTGLGNGNAGAGWAFGAPSGGGAFGALGGAPGLGQARPSQLSGFAQIMGGGGSQVPIDMK